MIFIWILIGIVGVSVIGLVIGVICIPDRGLNVATIIEQPTGISKETTTNTKKKESNDDKYIELEENI
jgi:hypothetical protein